MEIRPWNFTFVKDLAFVNSGGQSTLYALQEYRYRGIPFNGMNWRGVPQNGDGYKDEERTTLLNTEWSVAIKIARFTPDLFSNTGTKSAFDSGRNAQAKLEQKSRLRGA